ncbi:MAG: helicase-related protein [Anaerolineae bacterium]
MSRLLDLRKFTFRCYHGRMAAQAREEVQELFREGIVKIIVATKAFGMEIDKADVRYVIHYDIPGDLESYFQEAGRVGRDGKTAYCVLLYRKSDLKTQQYFVERAFPSEAEIRALAPSLQQHVDDQGRILVRPEVPPPGRHCP